MADDDRPIAKKDLDEALSRVLSELRSWMGGRLETQEKRMQAQETRLQAQETRMLERLQALETRILERLEAQETRLLTAFHRYAEANHLRIQKVEVEQHLDGDRLTKLEERVRTIEERLDFPNQFRKQQA